jgi:hypothetical protein
LIAVISASHVVKVANYRTSHRCVQVLQRYCPYPVRRCWQEMNGLPQDGQKTFRFWVCVCSVCFALRGLISHLSQETEIDMPQDEASIRASLIGRDCQLRCKTMGIAAEGCGTRKTT